MLDVFSLAAKLTLDDSEYQKGLNGAKEKSGGLGSALKTAMGVGAAAIGAASAALTAFGKSAVDAGLSFDATMSEVAAISGATGEDFDALRQKAQEMGATTKFSASESAEALTYMAMAGWKTEDMLGGIEGIMNLAAASGENLATTSDIVTDALTAFGLSAEDSGRFADVLAAASSNANTNVSMLGESFKYVAPVAGAMGYSAEDVSVALGLMANNGIKASQAGTALRTLLGNMAKPTDEMASAMLALGVSLEDDEGNMKSLMEIMQDIRSGFAGGSISVDEYNQQLTYLSKSLAAGKINQEEYNKQVEFWGVALNGATEAQQAEYAAMLAGKEGMSGLLAIVNSSEEDFGKLTEAIYEADGAAEKMSATMQDNLQGDMTIMQSALEGLKIAVSDGLTPSLREFVQFGSDGLSRLTTAFQEGGLSSAMGEFGNILSEGISMIIDQLPSIISAGAKLVGALGEGLINNLPQLVDAAIQIVTTLAGYLVESIPQLIPAVVDIIFSIVDKLTAPDTLGSLIDASIEIMMAIANGLMDAIPRLLEKVPEILDRLTTTFIENAPKLLDGARELIEQLVNGLKDTENLKKVVQGALNLIVTLASGLVDAIPVLLESLPEIITALVQTLIELAPELVKAAAQIIAELVLGIVENLDKIGEVAGTLIDAFVNVVTEAFARFVDLGKEIVGGIWEGISGMATEFGNKVKGFFDGVIGGVKKALGINSPSRLFRDEVGKNIVLGLTAGIENNGRQAIAAATELAENVYGSFQDMAPDMSQLFEGEFPEDIYAQQMSGAGAAWSGIDNVSLLSSIRDGRGAEEERQIKVEINFTGSLSQLARVLQPEIIVEGKRRGTVLVGGV